MDPLGGLIIAAYARFSSDNQKDTSIDDQLRLARGYVERQDGRLSDEFIMTDYAMSGASRARAGFERLLGLIENRKINVVVTESASRLSRDLGDADRLWKLAEFFGVCQSPPSWSQVPRVFATLMEPPDRQGHGATSVRWAEGFATLMEPPDRQGHGATSVTRAG